MENLYFRFLIGLIGDEYIAMNYQNLLQKLWSKEYVWELDLDKNRAIDGINLRYLCAQNYGVNELDQDGMIGLGIDISRPCSVLEMMVALARRTEDKLMHDPDLGDRSGVWFWQMME